MNFTPGPWWTDDDGCVAAGPNKFVDYTTICEIINEGMQPGEADANAALISAAPELHDLVKRQMEVNQELRFAYDNPEPDSANQRHTITNIFSRRIAIHKQMAELMRKLNGES